jgi:hypothetical protein
MFLMLDYFLRFKNKQLKLYRDYSLEENKREISMGKSLVIAFILLQFMSVLIFDVYVYIFLSFASRLNRSCGKFIIFQFICAFLVSSQFSFGIPQKIIIDDRLPQENVNFFSAR